MEQKQQQFSVGYFILALIIMLMVQNYFASPHTQTITYSQFKDLTQKGLIENVAIGAKIIHGSVKGQGVKEILPPEQLKTSPADVKEGKKPHPFNTVRVEDPGLTDELQNARIPFQGEISSSGEYYTRLGAHDLPAEEGVLVAKVEGGSPGAKAGLKVGDIITALGGDKVKNVADLRSAVGKKKIDEKVNVEINRNKKRSIVSLTLRKMPEG